MADVVRLGAERSARKPSLDGLQALIGEDLARVNQTILARMTSRVPLIPELAGHLIGVARSGMSTEVRRFQFEDRGRDYIRRETARAALQMGLKMLEEEGERQASAGSP